MPIYAYKCESCGHRQDVLQKMSDPVLTVCPACSAPTFAKQLTAAGFQLKGSGWYVTDFRDGGGAKAGDKADGEKSTEKSAEKSTEKAADKTSDKADGPKAADKAPASAAPASAPAPAPKSDAPASGA